MLEALNGNIGRGGVDANTIFELDMDKPVGSVDLYDKVSSLKLQRTGGTSQFVDHPEYGKVFEFNNSQYAGVGAIKTIPLATIQWWSIELEFLTLTNYIGTLFETGNFTGHYIVRGTCLTTNQFPSAFLQCFQTNGSASWYERHFLNTADPKTMNRYRVSRRPDGMYMEDLTRSLSYKTPLFDTLGDTQLYIGTSGESPPSYIFRGYLKNFKISKLEI